MEGAFGSRMTYLSDKRLNLIYQLLSAKIQSCQTINGYLNEMHNYQSDSELYMREAHFITSILPGETKTMSSVAEALAVTKSAASQIASKLESKGYIIRSHDKDDKRIVNVSLSEKGEQFYHEHIEFDSARFAALNEEFALKYSDEELEQLIEYELNMAEYFRKSRQNMK